jgi:serine/threonine-protein kinase
MELIEGETLQGPLPLDTAITYARQIAEALEAAHEKGIIHRDLKPANIKITPGGVVKVLDFGLAKTERRGAAQDNGVTASVNETEPGVIVGTAAYMSPEQATGKSVDRRADIWAFGVVLYEMLTGRRPACRPFGQSEVAARLESQWKILALSGRTVKAARASTRPLWRTQRA